VRFGNLHRLLTGFGNKDLRRGHHLLYELGYHHPVYPVIKAAWTTTFNFLAGGICLLLLALFYLILDVWKLRRWSYFFRVIGMNSITIYMGVRIIDFKHTSDFVLNGIASYAGNFEPVVLFLGMILVEWLFLYYLYKNKIFLRV